MAATSTTFIPLGFNAPEFALNDTRTGALIQSSDYFGKGPTVVAFLCNHCPFVIHVLPDFVLFAKEMQSLGVHVLAISSNDANAYPQDGPDEMGKVARQLDFSFPYLFDEDQSLARAFDAACTPDFSVFNADNQCVYRGQFDGARPGNDIPVTGETLRMVISKVLLGHSLKEIAQPPSIGCSIKWRA
jgi:peroxiredoxin